MQDKEFYDVVAQELLESRIQAGVWTRAFSEAEGDKEKAKAIYIRFRVAELAEQARIQAGVLKAAKRRERISDVSVIAKFVFFFLACITVVSLVAATAGAGAAGVVAFLLIAFLIGFSYWGLQQK